MSVKVPILINGNEVGCLSITRQTYPPGDEQESLPQRYRWHAREWRHGWREVSGELEHKPVNGLFALVAAVCEEAQRLSTAKMP